MIYKITNLFMQKFHFINKINHTIIFCLVQADRPAAI